MLYRTDGRKKDQHRPINVSFGPETGCCLVTLGNTKLIAQATATVGKPRVTRPNEGTINIHVDTLMLGNSDEHVQLSRLLHKNMKESACLDLESFCIIGGEKVWNITIDISILNHEGNLVEAASIATIAALQHHRRPEVSVDDGELIFEPQELKEQQRIAFKHTPFLVKFTFIHIEDNYVAYIDPSDEEERNCDGSLVVGSNEFGEITCLQISGKSVISKDDVLKQSNFAVRRTQHLAMLVKKALDNDEVERTKRNTTSKSQHFRGTMFETLAKVY